METFIIGYMVVNEVAGVAMAVGYIKYLQKSGYFMQRKIEKWRSKNLIVMWNFGLLLIYLKRLWEKPKVKVKKNYISLVRLLLMMLGESFRVALLAIFSLKPLFMLSKIFIVPLIKK